MYIYIVQIYIILAASPLASSGFAAIGCCRASPYGGTYIVKNYSKLTEKKSHFYLNPIFFCLKPSLTKTELTKKELFKSVHPFQRR